MCLHTQFTINPSHLKYYGTRNISVEPVKHSFKVMVINIPIYIKVINTGYASTV